ncbi:Larval cuticle protein A3A, partial [Folsomia candida]
YKAAVKTPVHKTPIRVATDYNSGYKYDDERHRIEDDQAKNAKYSFGSAIDDGIMDHSHIRQETRDGLKVEGSYAYSDGYFKRVVNYVADENGYRVVSESAEPISESGPNVDLVNGKADIHTQIDGVDNQYSVSAAEILKPMKDLSKH